MKLDLFNNLFSDIKKEGIIQNFMNELSGYMKKDVKSELNQENSEQSLLTTDEIVKKYNLNMQSSIQLREERDKIIKEYCTNSGEELYYITYKYTDKDVYAVSEYNEEGKSNTSYLSESDLPENIREDVVLKKENDKYIIDENATKSIIKQIEECAIEIANKQESQINNLRKENALYQVVGFTSKGVTLRNLENNIKFEETEIKQDIKSKIGIDYILKYSNSEYNIEEEQTAKFLEN